MSAPSSPIAWGGTYRMKVLVVFKDWRGLWPGQAELCSRSGLSLLFHSNVHSHQIHQFLALFDASRGTCNMKLKKYHWDMAAAKLCSCSVCLKISLCSSTVVFKSSISSSLAPRSSSASCRCKMEISFVRSIMASTSTAFLHQFKIDQVQAAHARWQSVLFASISHFMKNGAENEKDDHSLQHSCRNTRMPSLTIGHDHTFLNCLNPHTDSDENAVILWLVYYMTTKIHTCAHECTREDAASHMLCYAREYACIEKKDTLIHAQKICTITSAHSKIYTLMHVTSHMHDVQTLSDITLKDLHTQTRTMDVHNRKCTFKDMHLHTHELHMHDVHCTLLHVQSYMYNHKWILINAKCHMHRCTNLCTIPHAQAQVYTHICTLSYSTSQKCNHLRSRTCYSTCMTTHLPSALLGTHRGDTGMLLRPPPRQERGRVAQCGNASFPPIF